MNSAEVAGAPGQPKVGEPPAVICDHHVRGFDVAMHQTMLVQLMNGACRILQGAHYFGARQCVCG